MRKGWAARRLTGCTMLVPVALALAGPAAAQAPGAAPTGGRVSAGDLIALLGVALRGGGHEIADAEVARLPLAGGLDAVSAALGEVLAAAFGEAPGAANPP